MPLSEHEQRLKFASAVRQGRSRGHTRRWIFIAAFGVIAGLTVVLVGLAAKLVVLGVLGFVLIVASCVYIATMLRSRPAGRGSAGDEGGAAKSRRSGVRSRMEDRLRRRFDEE